VFVKQVEAAPQIMISALRTSRMIFAQSCRSSGACFTMSDAECSVVEPASKRQKGTAACSGCGDLFFALRAQHPTCVSTCISNYCLVDWQVAGKLLATSTLHPFGAASIEATSTPDCTACLQAVLRHSHFSLVQQHSECHQRILVSIAGRLAKSGCTTCLAELLSTQRLSSESWKLAVSRVLYAESSQCVSALKLLLAAAPESTHPDLWHLIMQDCCRHSQRKCAEGLIPLMDYRLSRSDAAHRADVCCELLAAAVDRGCADCVNHLVVTHQADVNAAVHGRALTLLQKFCNSRSEAVVKALLQHGADVFAVTAVGGENVLHLAADLAVHSILLVSLRW
jgi:hypothetical protein